MIHRPTSPRLALCRDVAAFLIGLAAGCAALAGVAAHAERAPPTASAAPPHA